MACAPIADRCTKLTGHPCLGANNFAMNVALGHAPDTSGIHFVPRAGECAGGMNFWYPPSRVRKGYQGTAEIQGSIYDTRRILSWVWDRFASAPGDYLVTSVGNALDLLSTDYWPDDYAVISARQAVVFAQVFLVVVLVPALAVWGWTVRRFIVGRRVADGELLLVVVVVAVFLVSFVALGSARYREPFDCAFIALAARAFSGRDAPPPTAARSRVPLALAGVFVFALTGLLAAAAHPSTHLASWLAERVHPIEPAPARLGTHGLAEFAKRRDDGSPWDAPGNLRFRCSPDCTPITIGLDAVWRSTSIDVSTDSNDRYEIVFYRAGVNVGRLAWGLFEGERGMRRQHMPVPASAVEAGFDTLTVRPLYGDGNYSLGHLLLQP